MAKAFFIPTSEDVGKVLSAGRRGKGVIGWNKLAVVGNEINNSTNQSLGISAGSM